MQLRLHGASLGLALALGAGCATAQVASTPDTRAHPMVDALYVLAADSMEGRQTGTPGNERARRFLLAQLRGIGVAPLGGSFEHPFDFTTRQGAAMQGINLLAVVRGTVEPERYIVLSAHFDHVGVRDGEIYNGADDNASGTAAVLEIARRLRAAPPRHSVILALFDAEEMGLRGAAAFVESPPVPRESIMLNLNMDMVSRSEEGLLWAVGTSHYPQLKPVIEAVAAQAPVTLRMGHDTVSDTPGYDWTFSSDHGPFHRAGIPFLYFGVEDHEGYHKPSDDAEAITPEFYLNAVETVWRVFRMVDSRGAEMRSR
ncbi:MAG TPA: M20/M25/M40 family metallo-hydrolase [Gemmatimonadales bacterium]|nr:M20/M25/M40 family metallo-hydrolase [Gemmatimonadales bacterium]